MSIYGLGFLVRIKISLVFSMIILKLLLWLYFSPILRQMIDSNAKVCVVYLAWLLMVCNISEISSDRIAVMKGHPHDLVCFNGLALPQPGWPEAYLQYMKEAGVSVFQQSISAGPRYRNIFANGLATCTMILFYT